MTFPNGMHIPNWVFGLVSSLVFVCGATWVVLKDRGVILERIAVIERQQAILLKQQCLMLRRVIPTAPPELLEGCQR